MSMPCFECFYFSPIVACNILNNFSFTSVACNNVEMFDSEIAPIASSHIGDVSVSLIDLVPSFTLHSDYSHMSHFPIDFGVFGDVQMKRHFMMDDVFIYHVHNFFLWIFVCIEPHAIMSTSIKHELTKRALESIHFSCGPFPCYASNKLTNFSYFCLFANMFVILASPLTSMPP